MPLTAGIRGAGRSRGERIVLAAAVCFLGWLHDAKAAVGTTRLEPRTAAEFQTYVKTREAGLERRAQGSSFLWCAERAERLAALRRSGVVIEPGRERAVTRINDGLVHDWIGATFIPGATLARTLAFLQNYDNHKNAYAPEVADSKLLGQDGDRYRVYLRLRKHKIVTVVLNTEYDVNYRRLSATRAWSRSYSTRIAEVEDPGTSGEKEMQPGHDHGFLWRLNSYWRFEERDGGTYVECEAISLSRDVPTLLSGLIMPIVKDLPEESLRKTLEATRNALMAR